MNSRGILSKFICIIVSVVTIVGMFLPYIQSTPEYGEYLKSMSNQKPYDTVDITAEESVELSLYEYAKTYYQGRNEIFDDKTYGIFYAILFSTPGFFGILALLFSFCNKPVLIMLQSLLIGGAAYLINWDVIDRRIMPYDGRIWGVSHVLFYPCALILFVFGMLMFITKHRLKKERRHVE